MAETRETKLIVTAVDQTQAALSAVGRGLGNLNAAMGGLLGPVAALTSVAGFAGLIQQAVATGDELVKLSQKTGASVEALSKYQYAAKLANTSNDELRTGLIQLQKNLGEAISDPAGRTARTFQALGIAVTDARGQLRGTDAVLDDLAKRFEAAPDGPAKTAAAVQLLGRSGAELIPFLNGMRESAAEAERLGLTISTDFAKKAEQFNDNLERMQSTLSRLAITISGPVVELFNRLAEAISGNESLDTLMRQRAQLATQFVAVKDSTSAPMQQLKANILKDIDEINARIIAMNRRIQGVSGAGQPGSRPITLPPAEIKAAKIGGISANDEAFRAEAEVSKDAYVGAGAIEARANLEESKAREAAARLAEVHQEAMTQEFEQLSQSLLSQTDLQNAKYANDMQTLYDARAAQYLTESQFNDARVELELRHRAQLGDITAQAELKHRQIERMSWQQRLAEAEQGFAKLVPMMHSKHKAIFEIGKLAAIAQVGVKIPQGAVEAYEAMLPIPIIGPALGIAAAAAYVGFSLEQMAAIKGQSFGGGAAGGATPTFDVNSSTGLPVGTPGGNVGNVGATIPVPQPDGNPLMIVVNLDGQPILETVQRASNDGRIVINAHAVRG